MIIFFSLKPRGAVQHRGSVLATHPAAPGLILGVPKIFFLLMQLSFICCTTQNSRQRLYNVNQTHIVLASGRLVLRKKLKTDADLAHGQADPLLDFDDAGEVAHVRLELQELAPDFSEKGPTMSTTQRMAQQKKAYRLEKLPSRPQKRQFSRRMVT